jgi:hypothetical protein
MNGLADVDTGHGHGQGRQGPRWPACRWQIQQEGALRIFLLAINVIAILLANTVASPRLGMLSMTS